MSGEKSSGESSNMLIGNCFFKGAGRCIPIFLYTLHNFLHFSQPSPPFHRRHPSKNIDITAYYKKRRLMALRSSWIIDWKFLRAVPFEEIKVKNRTFYRYRRYKPIGWRFRRRMGLMVFPKVAVSKNLLDNLFFPR